VEEYKEQAKQSAEQLQVLLSEIKGGMDSLPRLRFENFDDIVNRCITAMLKLELPEVYDPMITFTIKENVD
ncbi:phage tail protein, partial [Yersinia enterocolitica]